MPISASISRPSMKTLSMVGAVIRKQESGKPLSPVAGLGRGFGAGVLPALAVTSRSALRGERAASDCRQARHVPARHHPDRGVLVLAGLQAPRARGGGSRGG